MYQAFYFSPSHIFHLVPFFTQSHLLPSHISTQSHLSPRHRRSIFHLVTFVHFSHFPPSHICALVTFFTQSHFHIVTFVTQSLFHKVTSLTQSHFVTQSHLSPRHISTQSHLSPRHICHLVTFPKSHILSHSYIFHKVAFFIQSCLSYAAILSPFHIFTQF